MQSGLQIIHDICVKTILNKIFLAINYQLVKKERKKTPTILTLKFECFPIHPYKALRLNEVNIALKCP